MKIFVTGTRGIPHIPGGIEKHCEMLYPLIVQKGHEVLLATRSSYVKGSRVEWKGVKLIKCFSSRIKSFEAIIHTFIALFQARRYKPNVVHIHGVGPALLTPLAKFFGFRVVFTNHGPDYDRQKWGGLAKAVLRFGEKMGGFFANEIIVISDGIKNIIRNRCHRESNLIYNGVSLPELSSRTDFLSRCGIIPKKYILAVGRFVPEKGFADLIDAFQTIDTDFQLVIAGDADHETEYSRMLRNMSAQNNRIILTGYIVGDDLNQLFTHTGLFILASYHEGLPIALLEAMSYGLPVLVSDIPANVEVDLPPHRYFRKGDISDLRSKLEKMIGQDITEREKQDFRAQIVENYNWSKIAEQTITVYKKAIS